MYLAVGNGTGLEPMSSSRWFSVRFQFLAANHIHLGNITGVRIARGIRSLPAILGYQQSITILWKPSDTRWRTIEVDSENGRIGETRIAQDHPDWLHLRVAQILVSTEEVYTPGTDPTVTNAPRETVRLNLKAKRESRNAVRPNSKHPKDTPAL